MATTNCSTPAIAGSAFRTFLVAAMFILFCGMPALVFAASEVNLILNEGSAAESGQVTGSFTVSRTDDGEIGGFLDVRVAISGDATLGVDYLIPAMWAAPEPNEYWVRIEGAQLSTIVTLTPALDNAIENTETATFTLVDIGSVYTVGGDTQASIDITNDTAEVTLTPLDSDAAEAGQAPGSFTVTRTNQGNVDTFIDIRVAISGDATLGVDYLVPAMWAAPEPNEYWVRIEGAQLSTIVTLTPVLDNLEQETDETATFTLVDIGASYITGTPNQATITILNFSNVVFRDSFEN